ncbi:9134_t:CDS:1, partial [Dentiscutata heterogama]
LAIRFKIFLANSLLKHANISKVFIIEFKVVATEFVAIDTGFVIVITK